MPCPRCGCRMVSPGGSGLSSLVCSDCGLGLDQHLKHERPLWRWRDAATLILIGAFALTALALIWMRDALTTPGEQLDAPAQEKREAAEE